MPKKGLFVAGREVEYVRNSVITKSLRSSFDITIIVDNTKLLLFRYVKIILKVLKRNKRDYDFTFVGFYGTPIMIIGPILFGKKIIFDAFISTYDTICNDRMLINPNSIIGKFLLLIDKISLNNAAHILVDTNENKNYLEREFNIPSEKISRVYVGCDENIFFFNKKVENKNTVLFYSTYQPLHGTINIIKAASIVQEYSDIQFHIYGSGQEYLECVQSAHNLKLINIKFYKYIEYIKLPKIISTAKICLAGPFGNTLKAKRVITGKTFQFLYMKKPVIVGDSNAVRELLTPKKDAEFCQIGNPNSLAESIMRLDNNPQYRNEIAVNGYRTYMKKARNSVINNQIKNIIDRI
jgi:glycosyltransferase involved in cell wall biosynthesis